MTALVSVRIEQDLKDKIDENCRRSGRTGANLLRMAVKDFLEKHADD